MSETDPGVAVAVDPSDHKVLGLIAASVTAPPKVFANWRRLIITAQFYTQRRWNLETTKPRFELGKQDRRMFLLSCFPIFLIQVPIPGLKLSRYPRSFAATVAALPSISEIPFLDSWVPD
jgi:hypothetical protein